MAASGVDEEISSPSSGNDIGPGTKRKLEMLLDDDGPKYTFKLTHGKQTYEITFPTGRSIADLKQHIESLTGVHANMQKLLYKGMLKDDQTLEEAKVADGAKVILMASKVEDIVKIATASATPAQPEAASTTRRVSLSEQTEHKKILDKGKPDDADPGIISKKMPLPPAGLKNMLNSRGGKTRLTFKLELDQVWIGTNERTQKLPLGSIKNVRSEAIKGHEDYHILALQLGPTEKSNYYLYWVPAQYVESIKDAILGPFAAFF